MPNPVEHQPKDSHSVQLQPQGLRLSRMVFGTWRILDTKDEAEKSPEAILKRIKHCLQLGITTFDLADIYGGGEHQCEIAFGKALALEPALRSRMQLVSKCGIVCANTPVKHYNTSAAYIKKRVDETLKAVGADHLDLLLIHRPDPFMDADDVAAAMVQLKQDGRVLHFGVSNFMPGQVDLLQSRLPFPLACNQIEMSVLCLDPLYNGVLEQCQEKRMIPMIWSPLAGGRIFSNDGDERVTRVQKQLKATSESLKSATVDQVAFAWLLAHPAKCVPIVGSGQLDRITAATRALDVTLTREQWFQVLEASNGKRVP